jgi:DNA excision repair protein ERCC-2
VDCIICDYNYAFDPRVYLRRFFLETSGNYTFLVDETHNLVDRAREMFSAEIRKQPFLDIRRAMKGKLPGLYTCMGKINSWLLGARKRCEIENSVYADEERPEDLLPLLDDFIERTQIWLAQNLSTSFRDELLELYFEANWFSKVGEEYNERYATYAEIDGRDLRLRLLCLDPSERLREALKRSQSAIFFSATMTPMEYFRNILGCEETARMRTLPSPFPRENLCLLTADRISTLYKHREQTIPDVTQILLASITLKKGNYLLFFPSYRYMQTIYDAFTAQAPDIESIIQTSGMKEAEREQFLDRFAHDNPHTLVGFAVMGGIFGEGIDLVGDRLTGAVIVGVGLPGFCLERNLIRDYFTNAQGIGFEYAYMYPGINRVLQAAGRVIRTECDRGMVLLIDTRFATMRYRRLFPPEWQPVRVRDGQQVQQHLREFWEQS